MIFEDFKTSKMSLRNPRVNPLNPTTAAIAERRRRSENPNPRVNPLSLNPTTAAIAERRRRRRTENIDVDRDANFMPVRRRTYSSLSMGSNSNEHTIH